MDGLIFDNINVTLRLLNQYKNTKQILSSYENSLEAMIINDIRDQLGEDDRIYGIGNIDVVMKDYTKMTALAVIVDSGEYLIRMHDGSTYYLTVLLMDSLLKIYEKVVLENRCLPEVINDNNV